jgi:hypothetical protein
MSERWSVVSWRTGWTLLVGALMLASAPAWAQDEAEREAELFGAEEPAAQGEPDAEAPPASSSVEDELFGETPEETPEETSAEAPAGPASRDDRFLSGGSGADDAEERIAALIGEADRELALGGYLLMQPTARITGGQPLSKDALSSANLVDLYLDARPNERVRAYVRGRLLYDYTAQAQSQTQASGLDLSTGTLGGAGGLQGTRKQTQVQLDQLWIKFDIERVAYVTVGRQRIRWGSSRFWNPTDFLNVAQINPLAIFDARLGVDLVKVHVPLEELGWNLYAIGSLGGASTLGDVGGALRGEFVFGQTELALSGQIRRQTFAGPAAIDPFYTPKQTWPNTTTPTRLGLDISSALGPLDVHAELAATHNSGQAFYRGNFDLSGAPFNIKLPEDYSREDDWIIQAVAGFEWLIGYGDSDTLAITAEYFYNDAGYDNSDLYLWMFLQGGFRPLYTGRHYAALGIALPGPGSWDDTTFALSAIGNLSDNSFLNRLDYRVRVLSDLSVGAFVSVQYGQNGELYYRVTIPPVPGDMQLANGLDIPPARATVGASLQMSF